MPLKPSPLKRGKSLSRHSSLERSGPPERRTPIKKVNRERRARLHERNFPPRDPDAECLVARELRKRFAETGMVPLGWTRCCSKLDQAHVRARGMGGCKGDKNDVVDLCRVHHDESEHDRRGFEEKYGLNLRAEADSAALRRREAGDK